jgi:tetratricopeptide (TPR) repeat protein
MQEALLLFSLFCLTIYIEAKAGEPVDYEVIEKRSGKDYANGYAAAEQGKYDEAVKWFSKSINEKPEQMETYMDRTQAYLKLKKYREALADLEKYAVMFDRTSRREDGFCLSGISLVRGEALEGLGRYDEAVKCYKDSLQKRDSVEAHTALGDYYKTHGKKDLAIKEYQGAKKIFDLGRRWSTHGSREPERHVDEMLSELQNPLAGKNGKQPEKKK